MSKAREEIRVRDFHGVRRLLDAYGGMGSFNDLYIGYRTSAEGTIEERPDFGQKNQQLESLRTRAYELAMELKREHSAGA